MMISKLLPVLLVLIPLNAFATQCCLNGSTTACYTVTYQIECTNGVSNNAYKANGVRDVIAGTPCDDYVEADNLDIVCTYGGDDLVLIYSYNQQPGNIAKVDLGDGDDELWNYSRALVYGRNGNDHFLCVDSQDFTVYGQGGVDTLDIYDDCTRVVFYGGSGNDRLNINGALGMISGFGFLDYDGGNQTDTIDLNGVNPNDINNYSLTSVENIIP